MMASAGDKFQVPTDQELAARYDDDLAEALLEKAKATDKIPPDEFAGQLWNWACANAKTLRRELDFEINPATADVRKELDTVHKHARSLYGSLVFLSSDASATLSSELSGDPDTEQLNVFLSGHSELLELMSRLDDLCPAAEAASKRWDGAKIKVARYGRIVLARKRAVDELAVAWNVITGERPKFRRRSYNSEKVGTGYGPFRDFVVMALEPIFGASFGEKGLDAVVQGVVTGMINMPDDYGSDIFHL